MSVAPVQFALGHEGIVYGAKLLDENGVARNLFGFTELEVIITNPNGTKIIKKTTDGVVPENPGSLNDTNIIWKNDTGASILDIDGYWTVSVAARFAIGSYIPSYEKVEFWVV